MDGGLINRSGKSRRPRRAFGGTAWGFVLMEVLVSVAILSVGITVLLQSIISSLDANRLTQEYTRAIFLAESKMWDLEHQYAFKEDMDTGDSYGDFDPPFHDFGWRTEIEAMDEEVEYSLRVKVTWVHRSIEQEYALESLVPMRRKEEDLK